MTAAYEEVPFSDLLHSPAVTARRLDQVRALRLRHCDAGDLVLMRVEQLEAEGIVVDFTARLLADLIRTQGTAALREVLPDVVPWVAFLPADDAELFLAELADIALSAVSLGDLMAIGTLLAQWRHTAEVYADPALLAILTREPEVQ